VLRGSGVDWDLRRDGEPICTEMYDCYKWQVIASTDGRYPDDHPYPPVPREAVLGDEEGEFSLAALEHYRDMLRACQEHNITPIVTFHHFTSPRWLMARGGWESKKTPDRFARYCERATRYLGDLIGAACTLNEANIASVITKMGFAASLKRMRKERWWLEAAEAFGVSPKRLSSFMYAASPKAEKIILRAHRQAVEAIKSASGKFPVGITLALQDIQAAEGGEKFAAKMRREINDVSGIPAGG
jgi:beta-glucosidase